MTINDRVIYLFTIRKHGVLELTLQLNFWVAFDTWNSPYIWCNSLQFNYNFVTTTWFQLLSISPMTTIIMSCWHHFSSIHQILTHGTMKIFHNFFWNINIHCPLWLFILYGFGLGHLAQSKVITWHINWILETKKLYIYIYIYIWT
jgi:hypothetical protein